MLARLVPLCLLLLLLAAAPARAGDPIMPLSEVKSGMRCTGLTVVRGTEISSFDVEILDVVAPEGVPGTDGPRILIRVSGPAVDETGLGAGFSGSPIYCRDGEGTARNAGAISEAIGEYGNEVGLATPIEQILGEPVEPPRTTRRRAAARPSAGPLAGPLTVTGLSRGLARMVATAARRAGRTVLAAPAGPLGSFPPQQLRPGAAMAVGLSTGDVTVSGVGTVAYEDAGRVWAYGHPFDMTGRRSLLLQDAYVYRVVNNPLGVAEASTYKLAAPGHSLGTLTNDASAAVVGRLGALPAQIPMRVVARDLDSGRRRVTQVQIADETALGQPSGVSGLQTVGSLALAQATSAVTGTTPARQSGSMCLRIRLRERRRPLRFCNTYAVRGEVDPEEPAAPLASLLVADYSEAVGLLDSFNFGPLHVTKVDASVKVHRGLRQAFMVRGSGPRVVRPGRRVTVRVQLRRVLGPRSTLPLKVRIPRSLRPGRRTLTLTGTPADLPEDELLIILGPEEDEEDQLPEEDGGPGALSVAQLARRFARIRRYDGVRARFSGRRRGRGGGVPVHRDPDLRISGRVRIPLRVAAPRR